MNRIRYVKKCISQQKPIQGNQSGQSMSSDFSVIGKLLSLIRNSILQQKINPPKKCFELLILQQLTTVVSELVNFNDALKSLVKLDRQSFKKQCRASKSLTIRQIGEYIYGVYQQHDLKQYPFSQSKILVPEREGYRVGTNWKTCRQALFSVKTNNQLEQQFLDIILCDENNLTKESYLNQEWRQLWTYVYIWTISVLEQKILPEEYSKMNLIIENFISRHHDKYPGQQTDQIITALVRSILGIITRNTEKCQGFLVDAFEKYINCINQKNRQSILNQVEVYLVFKSCLNVNKLSKENLSKKGFQIIERKLKHKQKQKMNLSQLQLYSYLLSPQQLQSFLKKNALPFWQYEINQNLKQKVALSSITSLEPDFKNNKADWKSVILNLSSDDLKDNILSFPQKWLRFSGQNIEFGWVEPFFQLCGDQENYQFQSKIGNAIDNIDLALISQDLKIYRQQWRNFFSVKKDTKGNISVNLKEFITFDSNTLSSNFKNTCVLPQQLPNVYQQFCQKYLQLLNMVSQIPSQQMDSLFNFGFIDNLKRFSSQKWDSFWNQWTIMLLNNKIFMKDLINIRPQDMNKKDQRLIRQEQSKEKADIQNPVS